MEPGLAILIHPINAAAGNLQCFIAQHPIRVPVRPRPALQCTARTPLSYSLILKNSYKIYYKDQHEYLVKVINTTYIRGCRSINKVELRVSDAIFHKFLPIIFRGLIQTNYMGHTEMFEHLQIVLWTVTQLLLKPVFIMVACSDMI